MKQGDNAERLSVCPTISFMCLFAWTSSGYLVHHLIGIRGSCAPLRALSTTLHVVPHGEGVLLEQTGRPNHEAQGKVIFSGV